MIVLITGGTGSLGRVLVEKLINDSDITKVIVYSRGEHKQEKLERDLSIYDTAHKLRFFIGDVRDKERLRTAIMSGVSHVIHTAALKIVPAMEYNPQEAIKTNILGTQNVMEVCGERGVFRAVLVSTDKAVYPLNLYGATKLCAEKLTLSINNIYPGTCFDVVRYGNVAMSAGSVIPLFRARKLLGNPLPVTSLDMTRFWITLDEAANFVINRAFAPYNNIRGSLHVPVMDAYHMEDLVSIYSTEGVDNKIIGLRPGEKIHEQILTDPEVINSSLVTVGDKEQFVTVHKDAELNKTPTVLQRALSNVRSNMVRRIPREELKAKIEALV